MVERSTAVVLARAPREGLTTDISDAVEAESKKRGCGVYVRVGGAGVSCGGHHPGRVGDAAGAAAIAVTSIAASHWAPVLLALATSRPPRARKNDVLFQHRPGGRRRCATPADPPVGRCHRWA